MSCNIELIYIINYIVYCIAIIYYIAVIHQMFRSDLQMIAGRLVIVGAIECIARPILLAWPLWRLMSEAIQLIRAIDEKKGQTPVVIVQLLKSLLLLFAVMQLIRYLEIFRGAGYACGVFGLLLLFIQSQDYLLKPYVLALAENLSILSNIMEQVHMIELKMLGDPTTNGSSTGGLPAYGVEITSTASASALARDVDAVSKPFAVLRQMAVSVFNSRGVDSNVSVSQGVSVVQSATEAKEESEKFEYDNKDDAEFEIRDSSLKEPTSQLRHRRKQK